MLRNCYATVKKFSFRVVRVPLNAGVGLKNSGGSVQGLAAINSSGYSLSFHQLGLVLPCIGIHFPAIRIGVSQKRTYEAARGYPRQPDALPAYDSGPCRPVRWKHGNLTERFSLLLRGQNDK
jgi:hypothetical protein